MTIFIVTSFCEVYSHVSDYNNLILIRCSFSVQTTNFRKIPYSQYLRDLKFILLCQRWQSGPANRHSIVTFSLIPEIRVKHDVTHTFASGKQSKHRPPANLRILGSRCNINAEQNTTWGKSVETYLSIAIVTQNFHISAVPVGLSFASNVLPTYKYTPGVQLEAEEISRLTSNKRWGIL